MNECNIADNIANLLGRVSRAIEKSPGNSGPVTVLAVSKSRPLADIRAAAGCGLRAFGENYLR
ncbi:MAG: YggS family pyridoxal phosphate enzyme, partial [Parahaliea sp.]